MHRKGENNILEKYLSRQQIEGSHGQDLQFPAGIIVVIPVYREEDFLPTTLKALFECVVPVCGVEIILVFNVSVADSAKIVLNQRDFARRVRETIAPLAPDNLRITVLEAYKLPKKHFGAGLARKIGMDLAAFRFWKLNKPDGVIVCLDSDTKVDTDYFMAIDSWFSVSDRSGAAIYFEHPVSGVDFPDKVYEGIVHYELHLRYYLFAHRYAGFPYAFHTMGSAMALRALSYARVGGMPRKQAGEDFYFLQKVIPLGNFGEIVTTTVRPSPRPSDRVIFGTGAAMTDHINGSGNIGFTYNIQAFDDLRAFFSVRHELYSLTSGDYESWTYKLSGSIRSFLLNSGVFGELDTIKKDCSSADVFAKRFYEVFNAFKIVKYLNYVHDHFFERMQVFDASMALLERMAIPTPDLFMESDVLEFYRNFEKHNPVGYTGNKKGFR
jgi:glycosyltransferase involved in cell wall biosynthesis